MMTKADEIIAELAKKNTKQIEEAAAETAKQLTDDESEQGKYEAIFMIGATLGLSLAIPGAIEMLKKIKQARDEGHEFSKVMVIDGREETVN